MNGKMNRATHVACLTKLGHALENTGDLDGCSFGAVSAAAALLCARHAVQI
jgi:hypothetical protein